MYIFFNLKDLRVIEGNQGREPASPAIPSQEKGTLGSLHSNRVRANSWRSLERERTNSRDHACYAGYTGFPPINNYLIQRALTN